MTMYHHLKKLNISLFFVVIFWSPLFSQVTTLPAQTGKMQPTSIEGLEVLGINDHTNETRNEVSLEYKKIIGENYSDRDQKNLQDLQVFNLYIELSGFEDQIAIVVREEATMNFDPDWDAYKFYSDTGIPNIASIAEDSTELSINSIPPFSEDINIPLKVFADPGTYNIRTYEDQVLVGTSCPVLEDLATGDLVSLTPNLVHSFDWTGSLMIEPRFLLHFSAPASMEIQHETCPGVNDGAVMVTGTEVGPWDYLWYDQDEVLINSTLASMSFDSMSDLEPGIYSVEILGGNSCGNNAIEFEVLPASTTELSIVNSTPDVCNDSDNGMIEIELFHNDQDMIWDLELNDPDGNALSSISSGVGMIIFNDLPADIYSISAINECENIDLEVDLNDENTVTSSFDVVNTIVNIGNGEELVLINTSGPADYYLWEMGDGNSSSEFSPDHTYAETGIYTVSLTIGNSTCNDMSSLVVEVVDEITGLSDIAENDFEVYLDQNANIVINSTHQITGELLIEIVNYRGQLIYQRSINNFEGQAIIPDLNVSGSIYIISCVLDGERIFSKRSKL